MKRLVQSPWPAFLAQHPAIVAKVLEPIRSKVVVMGAVEQPGVVELRNDQESWRCRVSESQCLLGSVRL